MRVITMVMRLCTGFVVGELHILETRSTSGALINFGQLYILLR